MLALTLLSQSPQQCITINNAENFSPEHTPEGANRWKAGQGLIHSVKGLT